MKKPVFSKKSKSVTDVVPQNKRQESEPKGGPVELNLTDLKKVSGGLPAGTWAKK